LLKKKNPQFLKDHQMNDLSSCKVWGEVNEAIVQNDMRTADAEKYVVEDDQRRRMKEKVSEDLLDDGQFFQKKSR